MTPELRTGLLAGLIAAGAVAVFVVLVSPSLQPRRARHLAQPIAGIALVVAALVALTARRSLPAELLVAMIPAGIVGAMPAERISALLATIVLVPFATVLAFEAVASPTWLRVLVAAVGSAGAVSVARTEAQWSALAVTPALFAVSAVAVFVAVPDTEEAAALAGAAVPIALLGWPIGLASLGRAGAGAGTVLLAWTAATGARAAPAAAVGALAALGLLVGCSVGARLLGDVLARASLPPARLPVAILLTQGALAILASRVGAGNASLPRAAVVATVVMVVSTIAGARLAPAAQPRHDRRGRNHH